MLIYEIGERFHLVGDQFFRNMRRHRQLVLEIFVEFQIALGVEKHNERAFIVNGEILVYLIRKSYNSLALADPEALTVHLRVKAALKGEYQLGMIVKVTAEISLSQIAGLCAAILI